MEIKQQIKQQIEQKIKQFADENNIIAGVCAADNLPCENAEKILDVPFLRRGTTVESRTQPTLLMPQVKSIIVVGVRSVGFLGKDYHLTVREVLESLRDELLETTVFESKIFVDTGSLVERELAVKARLGVRSKSLNILNPKLGTYFNIGYMLTDLELTPFNEKTDSAELDLCGDCADCINACPTGALAEGGYDYRKCVSYLTQKKSELTTEEERQLGVNVYGCDVCQRVCRFNREMNFELSALNASRPWLEEFVTLSDDEFRERYCETAMFWVGRETLQRNAKIALTNMTE